LTIEAADRLKERAKASGAKNLSVYARQILERPPEIDQEAIKEIGRVLDLTIRTRQAIGSLTGNINQIAKFYNTNLTAESAYLDFDRKNRAQLLPEVAELVAQSDKLIALCNRILR
jgi:hypothetical protein